MLFLNLDKEFYKEYLFRIAQMDFAFVLNKKSITKKKIKNNNKYIKMASMLFKFRLCL